MSPFATEYSTIVQVMGFKCQTLVNVNSYLDAFNTNSSDKMFTSKSLSIYIFCVLLHLTHVCLCAITRSSMCNNLHLIVYVYYLTNVYVT